MNRYILVCIVWVIVWGKGLSQVEAPVFSFGVIADVQYCDCEARNTRFYRNSPAKLDSCLEVFASEDLEFIAHLGDVIDRDFKSYDEILPHFNAAKVPVKFVLGNHEFSVDDSLKEQVPAKLGLSNRFYDFAVGKWRFIVTDGNDESLYTSSEGSKPHTKALEKFQLLEETGKPQAQNWNGGIGKKQLKWLKKTLQMAEKNNERVILFSHFPIYPADVHNLWNDRQIVDLLEAYPGVVAWMSGHNHGGGYEKRNGIYYLILHGMVETPDTTAFSVVDVYTNRLVVRGAGREPMRVLKFE